GVAGHLDNFRFLDRDADLLLEAGLSEVDCGIDRRFRVYIVQDAVGIEYENRTIGRENRHVRNIFAALLSEFHSRIRLERLPFADVVEGDDGIGDPAVASYQQRWIVNPG